jgi:hypothetical protein
MSRKSLAPDPLPDSIRITWNDWAIYRIQHRLVVDQVIMLGGGDTEIVCHDAADGKEAGMSSKLGALLYVMHRQAADKPGVVQRRTLAGGLRIDLVVGIDGMTRLQLSREQVYPSGQELATVLEAWPYPPPAERLPERFQYHWRFYVKIAWKTPEEKSINV